jgi:hypothetical protein
MGVQCRDRADLADEPLGTKRLWQRRMEDLGRYGPVVPEVVSRVLGAVPAGTASPGAIRGSLTRAGASAA